MVEQARSVSRAWESFKRHILYPSTESRPVTRGFAGIESFSPGRFCVSPDAATLRYLRQTPEALSKISPVASYLFLNLYWSISPLYNFVRVSFSILRICILSVFSRFFSDPFRLWHPRNPTVIKTQICSANADQSFAWNRLSVVAKIILMPTRRSNRMLWTTLEKKCWKNKIIFLHVNDLVNNWLYEKKKKKKGKQSERLISSKWKSGEFQNIYAYMYI